MFFALCRFCPLHCRVEVEDGHHAKVQPAQTGIDTSFSTAPSVGVLHRYLLVQLQRYYVDEKWCPAKLDCKARPSRFFRVGFPSREAARLFLEVILVLVHSSFGIESMGFDPTMDFQTTQKCSFTGRSSVSTCAFNLL